MAAATTKRCPGFTGEGYTQPAHDVPADAEHFGKHSGAKDGLQTYCRPCDRAYQKAWRERKARGSSTVVETVAESPSERREPDPPAPPSELAVSGVVPATRYHDELARNVARSKGKGQYHGWVTEEIDGTVYAVPSSNGAVGSRQGQEALEAVHEATQAARRKRDADRKRRERAAKKEREAAAAAQA